MALWASKCILLGYYVIILYYTIIAYYGQNQMVESEKEENPQPVATITDTSLKKKT